MTVLANLATLPGKSTLELNNLWRKMFNADPPQAGRTYLLRRLAYRIQELAHGGISEPAEVILDSIARGEKPPHKPTDNGDPSLPAPGTRILREWKGVEHVVTVLADGIEFQGRKYRSLSAVARAITGTQWNGPLFFGLRKGGRK
ncbi:MAG: DUF2924 domain-containing protein [Magnetococcales bacterium]|nr:DUF2924 domain-containing protein [Magnetococcales bacterium]